MKIDKLTLLQEELPNLNKSAEYLSFSLERCRELAERSNWCPEELERLESLTSRFSRLSDLLTQRIMRLIDELEMFPEGSLLDRFYRAEKRGWVQNAKELVQIRELRNLIAHEYAADKMAEIYRATILFASKLLSLVPAISVHADKLVRQYPR